MHAMVMTAPGPVENLVLQTLAKPMPGPHEVLVRLAAAGVNPVDAKQRQRGTVTGGSGAAVLGCDGAGTVELVGDAVSRFAPGDTVYYCYGGVGGMRGNYAEYACVPEHVVARKPQLLDFKQAAAAPLVLLTAWESLHDRGRLEPGQKVLIHAGAGGVGHVAIQLAKIAGAEVCTTVSTAQKAAFVESLGADKIVRYRDPDWIEQIKTWSHGGVDLAVDTVGGDTLSNTVEALRPYSDLVTILSPAADFPWSAARNRNLRFSLELMLTPMVQDLTDALQHQADILKRCAKLFDEDRLHIEVSAAYPLAQAGAAQTAIEGGSTQGKIVLTTAAD